MQTATHGEERRLGTRDAEVVANPTMPQGARGSHATPNGAPAPVESGAQAGRKTLTNSSEQLLKPLDLILHPPPNPSADAIIARMSQCTTRVGVTTRDLGTGDGGPNRGTASTPQTLPAGRAANVGDHQAATAATRGPNAAQGSAARKRNDNSGSGDKPGTGASVAGPNHAQGGMGQDPQQCPGPHLLGAVDAQGEQELPAIAAGKDAENPFGTPWWRTYETLSSRDARVAGPAGAAGGGGGSGSGGSGPRGVPMRGREDRGLREEGRESAGGDAGGGAGAGRRDTGGKVAQGGSGGASAAGTGPRAGTREEGGVSGGGREEEDGTLVMPMVSLQLGRWWRLAALEGEILCCVASRGKEITWKVVEREGERCFMIHCPAQHIRAVRFHLPNQGCQVLEIDVAACPTFTTERVSSEMTPSVQVSRALEPSLDFTGGFAASERTHRAVFPAGCLAPHLHRLLAGAPHQGAQGPPAPPALHPGLPFGIPGLATLAATMQSQSSAENTLMTMARLLQQLGIQQHLQAHDMEGPEDVISPMTSAEQEHVSGVSVDESRESLDREPPLQRGGAGLGVSGGVRECMPGDDLHARGGLCPHVTQACAQRLSRRALLDTDSPSRLCLQKPQQEKLLGRGNGSSGDGTNGRNGRTEVGANFPSSVRGTPGHGSGGPNGIGSGGTCKVNTVVGANFSKNGHGSSGAGNGSNGPPGNSAVAGAQEAAAVGGAGKEATTPAKDAGQGGRHSGGGANFSRASHDAEPHMGGSGGSGNGASSIHPTGKRHEGHPYSPGHAVAPQHHNADGDTNTTGNGNGNGHGNTATSHLRRSEGHLLPLALPGPYPGAAGGGQGGEEGAGLAEDEAGDGARGGGENNAEGREQEHSGPDVSPDDSTSGEGGKGDQHGSRGQGGSGGGSGGNGSGEGAGASNQLGPNSSGGNGNSGGKDTGQATSSQLRGSLDRDGDAHDVKAAPRSMDGHFGPHHGQDGDTPAHMGPSAARSGMWGGGKRREAPGRALSPASKVRRSVHEHSKSGQRGAGEGLQDGRGHQRRGSLGKRSRGMGGKTSKKLSDEDTASSGIEDRLAKDGTGMGQHSTDEGRESVPGSAPPHKSKKISHGAMGVRPSGEDRQDRRPSGGFIQ